MPTAGWLRRTDLPVDAAGRTYIDPANLDQILDQFVNQRGNVNGAAYTFNAGTIICAGALGVAGTPASLMKSGINVPKYQFISITGSNGALTANIYYDGQWRYHANGPGFVMKWDDTPGAEGIYFFNAGVNAGGFGAAAGINVGVIFTVTGLVSIGNVWPKGHLHVAGSWCSQVWENQAYTISGATSRIRFGGSGADGSWAFQLNAAAAGDFSIGIDAMRIASNGNISLCINSVMRALTVDGNGFVKAA